jgi:hypothetical protein
MRRAVLLTAAGVLLAGPTALAFFSGGYFDRPRLIATLVAWTLVLVVALVRPRPGPRPTAGAEAVSNPGPRPSPGLELPSSPLPGSWPGRAAIAGLTLLAAWTAVSLSWAPLSQPATQSLVRLLLYLGALIAAAALLRARPVATAVEPVLALGIVVVIGYGLSGRLLPGLIHLTESATAFGRLEQPITYWNAEGALAAIGFVLCARLAGSGCDAVTKDATAAVDVSRPVAMRALAAAAAAPLGLGVYLSFSRGAIAVAVVGLIVLLAAVPSRAQLRAVAIAVAAAVVSAACSAALPGVASLEGGSGRRETEGLIMLAILLVVMVAAAIAQVRLARAERVGTLSVAGLSGARLFPALALAAVALGLTGLVIGGLTERGSGADTLSQRHGASRLTSFESRRYDYWRVGVNAFAREPLRGIGAGGFRVEWLRERPVAETALEVHSLPLELAIELGIPGLLGLILLAGGVGAAGRRAWRRNPSLAAGACAGVTVWALHAAIDWDWQLPAVTLPAIVLAGALIADPE